jgi:PAS domain S-box-containing protein
MGIAQSPNPFDLLVSSVEDYAIFMVDLQGRISTWNSGAERIKGYSASEIVGQSIEVFYEPWERALKPKMLLQRAADSGSVEDEGWRLRKDGTRFWAHVSITALRDPEGKLIGFAKITADQTQRRAEGERLRQSEERFSNAFEHAPIGVSLAEPGGRLIQMNRAFCEMLGYSSDELLQLDYQAITHPDDLSTNLAHSERLLRGDINSYQMEKRYLRKNGEVMWGSVRVSLVRETSGKPKHFIAQMEDITKKREVEEALRAQTALLATVIDAMGSGLIVASQGKYLIVNRMAHEIMGHVAKDKGPEEWRAHYDLFLPDKQTKFDPENLPVNRALRGEASEETEIWMQHKHSSAGRWVIAAGRPLYQERGELSAAVVVFRDITEQKEMEAELELRRAQSVSNARLSALGMMAGSIAHEINNPLAVIHGAASNLMEATDRETPSPDILRKNTDRILRTAERIAKIVKSLRQISREGSSEPFRERSLLQIVDETLELCRERFRHHGVDLRTPAIPARLLVRCRDVQIAQLLLNLMQNAFDAVAGTEGEKWVEVTVEANRDTVSISVIDSGPGIPEEILPHIFEPFVTTKPVGQGTGLGLSISKTIAEGHGGQLEISSRSGNTSFRFTLPVAEGDRP